MKDLIGEVKLEISEIDPVWAATAVEDVTNAEFISVDVDADGVGSRRPLDKNDRKMMEVD